MCVDRYEMNTERRGGFIEMPVPDAIHLDACRRYATSPKALHAFQVFHAFHKCRVIVIVHLALHTPANAISDGGGEWWFEVTWGNRRNRNT